MCRAIRCKECGKTSWAGCGAHVAEVRAAVPPDQWCEGHDANAAAAWFRRFLSR